MYIHCFFIHLPVNGHLDYFHFLVVNNVAINIGLHVSFSKLVGFFSHIDPSNPWELLDQMIVLFLGF